MLAYNTSCNQGNGSIFIKNVEALADNDQEDDWVWDEILGYFIPVIHDPYKAPIF